ncbi:MAG: chemotaxis protein CheW [Armatimonadota bacterium]
MAAVPISVDVGPAKVVPIILCRVEGEPYGLPLATVERVLPMVELRRLPSAPVFLAGVIDYHGEVVPVVDLRVRFGLASRAPEVTQRLLLLQTSRRKLALLVDAVEGLRELPGERVVAPEALDTGLRGVAGVAALEDGVVIVQDVEALLSSEEERAVQQAIDRAAEGTGHAA